MIDNYPPNIQHPKGVDDYDEENDIEEEDDYDRKRDLEEEI